MIAFAHLADNLRLESRNACSSPSKYTRIIPKFMLHLTEAFFPTFTFLAYISTRS